VERIPLTLEEYESVRRGANRFFVLPEHVVSEVEEVVESNARYLVVSKLGEGASVAKQLGPRTRNAVAAAAL
jgi:hypothetical protein